MNPDDLNFFEERKTAADQADDPVRDWTSLADTEPGIAKAHRRRAREDEREHDGKGGMVTVHFNGTSWCLEDSSLEKPLQYAHLADAEARASEVAKDTGHSVSVRGQDGELIAAYGETVK